MATARNWVRKHGVKVIYIDYLGKIRTTDKKFGTREQEVSYITGHLKDLAKSLNIPIVALSQLSREVERRNGDKRPQLSDLRDSGSIEQDADIVLFPYRPEYYEIFKDEHGTPYPKGFTELIIAKYRHGQPGTLRWLYEPEFSRFRDCG
jgi:replicative DNA helicase